MMVMILLTVELVTTSCTVGRGVIILRVGTVGMICMVRHVIAMMSEEVEMIIWMQGRVLIV
ncbi:hypothetical protein A9G05_13140 [Pseudomonas sp. ENNP23]|nr:hypothetical protein A9G05_13140 [Pseudomonas sp. ENNP23]